MFIKAKFQSTCTETGQCIRKNDSIFWIKGTKLVFCERATRYSQERAKLDNDDEARSTRDYVEAQENAYFDNFCQNNNI